MDGGQRGLSRTGSQMAGQGSEKTADGRKSRMVGRQAFEDAQFEKNQDNKMKMIARVSSETYRYDTFFGCLILICKTG